MAIMFCPRDQRNVETVKGYSLGVLILLLLITLVGGIIYYVFTHKDKCPFCGSRDLMAPVASGAVLMPGGAMAVMPGQAVGYAAPPQMMQQPMAQPAAAAPTQNCTSCGKPVTWYAQQNRWWCAAENKWL